MEAKYLVLEKEAVIKTLTKEEVEVLDSFIDKIKRLEGSKTYVVNEIE